MQHCKKQVHDKEECRVLHPELRKVGIRTKEDTNGKEVQQGKIENPNKDNGSDIIETGRKRVVQRYWHPISRLFTIERNSDEFLSNKAYTLEK